MPAPEKPFMFPHRFRLCLVSLFEPRQYLSISQSTLPSVVRFLSPIQFRSVSFPSVSAVSTSAFVPISTPMSSLQYRRCTLQSVSFVLISDPSHISVGNFVQLLSRLRQCTLVLRFRLLLILLGSLSVPPLVLFTFLNVVSYVPASPTPTYA
jgi:hypothetical protein